MTVLDDVDATEIVAIVSLLGMIAAFVSTDSSSGDVNLSLPSDFGQSDSSSDESDDITDTEGISDPSETADPTEGDWNYQDPEDNPNSPEYEPPDLDFGGSDDSTDDGIDWGGPTGSNQPGTSDGTGDDDPASGPSPGDTTTGGTGIGTSEPLVDYDDVAGAADHLAGSTDEWVGGLW